MRVLFSQISRVAVAEVIMVVFKRMLVHRAEPQFRVCNQIMNSRIMKHVLVAQVSVVMSLVVSLMLAGCSHSADNGAGSIKEVRTMVVDTQMVAVPLRSPAQLRGKVDIAIVPQVNATIESVLVHEGDRVEKGQTMFVLNQTAYQAAVENAEAGVASAQVAVETQELELEAKLQLLDKNIISQHEYQVQENRVKMARASLAEAKAVLKRATTDLNYTVIRAPHTGVVGAINYKQGALVGPAIEQPVTIVSDNSVVYAYTSVSGDQYMSYINLYGTKEKMLRSLPDFSLILGKDVYYSHKGRMETISGIIDQNTGAVSMRIAFPNPDGVLTTGGGGQVEVVFDERAITLPRTAVFGIQDKNYVYQLEPADSLYVLRQTIVDVYRLNDTTYVVNGGLQAGEIVVTEGVKKLSNGEVVKRN